MGTLFQRKYKISHVWQARGSYEYRTAIDLDMKCVTDSNTKAFLFHNQVLVRACYSADRFRRELRALTSVDHPSIPQLRAAFVASLSDPKPAANMLLMEPATITAEQFWDAYVDDQAMLLNVLTGLTQDVIQGLVACQSFGIVHNGLRPFSIMYFPDPSSHDAPIVEELEYPGHWKIVGFDVSCSIGDMFVPKYIDFAGAEVVRAIMSSRPCRATPYIDVFSFGRCLQFFLYAHRITDYSADFYPGMMAMLGKPALDRKDTMGRQAQYVSTRIDRMKYLSQGKQPLYEVDKIPRISGPWRELLRATLQREPNARASPKKILEFLNAFSTAASKEDIDTAATRVLSDLDESPLVDSDEITLGINGGFDPLSLSLHL